MEGGVDQGGCIIHAQRWNFLDTFWIIIMKIYMFNTLFRSNLNSYLAFPVHLWRHICLRAGLSVWLYVLVQGCFSGGLVLGLRLHWWMCVQHVCVHVPDNGALLEVFGRTRLWLCCGDGQPGASLKASAILTAAHKFGKTRAHFVARKSDWRSVLCAKLSLTLSYPLFRFTSRWHKRADNHVLSENTSHL